MTRRWIGLLWVVWWIAAPAMAQGGEPATGGPGEPAGSAEGSGGEAAGDSSPKDLPPTSVLKTRVPGEGYAGMARTVTRSLRAALGDLDTIETIDSPGLGLRDLQLAVGCTEDTSACLKIVADKLDAGGLLLSSVEEVDDSLVLTLTFVDATAGTRNEAVRRASGDDASDALLDSLNATLRKVLELPPPASSGKSQSSPKATGTEPASAEPAPAGAKPAEGTAAGTTSAAAPAGTSAGRTWSPYPFVAGGVGVLALAVGTIAGVRSERVEDDYAKADPSTENEVDAALDDLERADRLAKTANAMFGIGAALAVGGTALFLVLERDALFGSEREPSEAKVQVAPTFSDHGAGLVLRGPLKGM